MAGNHETFIGSILRHGLRSKYLKNLLPFLGSAVNSVTGAHLTGAQQEANAFEAEQAQKQMDFQEQMSNTQYQRSVADMKAAGVNPALMYGHGAPGASTPSGAMAASESPGSPDVVGLLGQIANLSLLRAQARNLNARTEQTEAETDYTRQNLTNLATANQKMISEIQGLDYDNESKRITLKYLDEMQSVTLQNLHLTGDNLAAQFTETQQKISKLTVEQDKLLQDIVESKQRVENMLMEKDFTEAKIDEISHIIEQIDANTAKLISDTALNMKDIQFYGWNHVGSGIASLGAGVFGKVFTAVKGAKTAKAVANTAKVVRHIRN